MLFAWKKLLPRAVKQFVWSLACEHLQLKMQLSSGIPIKVNSYSDWCVYNDLFADGEYDEAIIAALCLPTRADGAGFVVVDLGANVGFFTLRVLHLMVKRHFPLDQTHFLLVEGSPLLAAELEQRFSWMPRDMCSMQFLTGLIGKKQGSDSLAIKSSQLGNRVVSDKSDSRSCATVDYVDIEPLLAGFPGIDLLKCDIEGSERDFLLNYGDLLQRTATAIFEFHEPECPAAWGVSTLAGLGFTTSRLLADRGNMQTWWFTRG